MTKDKMQVKIDEAESTVYCLELEKTKLTNDAKNHKAHLDSAYTEITELRKDVIELNRANRILKQGRL